MKKSIVTLGAVAALSGLGFATTAQAIAVFGDYGGAEATELALNPGDTGHMLIQPYYSTQGNSGTIFNITNTDTRNGKIVKVRLRSAANSDDVLDFTVFLSPGDVWTADLARDPDTGMGVLTSNDNSCVQPSLASQGGAFALRNGRLGGTSNLNVNEGYIEFLNMADVVPTRSNRRGDGVFEAIKHVDGVPSCDTGVLAQLLDPVPGTDSQFGGEGESWETAWKLGLRNPTGGLMGSWGIFNVQELATYSGNMTAVVASDGTRAFDRVTPISRPAEIAFAPQIGSAIFDDPGFGVIYGSNVNDLTADPLLRGDDPYIEPLWYDLPDMSTPIVGFSAIEQANELSRALSHGTIMNDYVSQGVWTTDWVVSQPTRRYHAAVAYAGDTGKDSTLVWNRDMSEPDTETTTIKSQVDDNRYSILTLEAKDTGPQACVRYAFGSTDREEKSVDTGADLSPGTITPYCGEVFTVSFNNNSVLSAVVTNSKVTPIGGAGWASLKLQGHDGYGIPVLGFAATHIKASSGNFGLTLPHRWNETSAYNPS